MPLLQGVEEQNNRTLERLLETANERLGCGSAIERLLSVIQTRVHPQQGKNILSGRASQKKQQQGQSSHRLFQPYLQSELGSRKVGIRVLLGIIPTIDQDGQCSQSQAGKSIKD